MKLLGPVFAEGIGLVLDGSFEVPPFGKQPADLIDIHEVGGVPVRVRHGEVAVDGFPVRCVPVVGTEIAADLFQPIAEVFEMIAQKFQLPARLGAGLHGIGYQVVFFSLAHGVSLRESGAR